jgi:hypothetical protein
MEKIEDLIKSQNPTLYDFFAPLVPYLPDPQAKTRAKFVADEIPSESRWIDIFDELQQLTLPNQADHLELLESIINEADVVATANGTSAQRISEFLKSYPTLRALLQLSEAHEGHLRGLHISACELLGLPAEVRSMTELDFIRSSRIAGLIYHRFPNVAGKEYSLERAIKELRLGLFHYLIHRAYDREGGPKPSLIGVTVVKDQYLPFTKLLARDLLLTPEISDLVLAYQVGARATAEFIVTEYDRCPLEDVWASPAFFKHIVLTNDQEMLTLLLELLAELNVEQSPYVEVQCDSDTEEEYWAVPDQTRLIVSDMKLNRIYQLLLHHTSPDMSLVRIYEQALVGHLSYDCALLYCLANKRISALHYLTTERHPTLQFFATNIAEIEEMTTTGDFGAAIAMLIKNCRSILKSNPELWQKYGELRNRSSQQ